LVKVRVKPFGVLWRTRRTCLKALFGRNASKMRKLPLKNNPHEVVHRVKGADLAPPSPTLLLTKQALRACLVRVRVKPFWRSQAYAEELSLTALFGRNASKMRKLPSKTVHRVLFSPWRRSGFSSS
jgi:hypothetical protein